MGENEYIESNNTFGKRGFFMMLLILSVVVAYVFSPLIEAEIAAESGPGEGLLTYNASRYFFRIDYPENWVKEENQNGFLLNKENGLVARFTPARKDYPGGDETDEDDAVLTRYDTVNVSFFYNVPSDVKSVYGVKSGGVNLVPAADLVDFYTERLRTGVLIKGVTGLSITSRAQLYEDEEAKTELYCTKFMAAGDDGSFSGVLYCASRPKAVYAILVTYSSVRDFELVEEEIYPVISSFRMTVLNDENP
ncbi:MAG: hypothetical protein K6B54_04255 [Clostridia bacterium]|nr:hypothetical protein [Clostridia bacterium]